MAVTFRSAGASAGLTTGANLTLDVPPSIVAGDYLIAFVHDQYSTATSDWVPPVGWTKIGPDFTPSSSAQRITSMFAKFATGSEPLTYTFTSPSLGTRSVGVIHAYTGVDATTPVAASSGFSALAATAATLDVSAFSAADGRYTIEMTAAQYANPNSYALSSYTGGLTLASSVFRASGATQDPPSEDTTVSRTSMHIWQGTPSAGGVPAHVITSTGTFSQRCVALISLNADGSGGGTITVTPSIVGHVAANNIPTGSTFDIDGSTVAVGDWIIVILSSAANMAATRKPTPPAGWTTIVPLQNPGTGSYTFGVWAHRRAVGETTYTWSQTTEEANSLASRLIMVRNADDIANWTIGTIGTRAASGGTTTTAAPSITTTRAHTLGLLLAGERTTATETDEQVTCDNFAKQWFENDRDHSIFVATKDMVTAGSTGSVTVTYPNAQAQNGLALILGIPGATDIVMSGLSIKVSTGTALEDAAFKLADGAGGLVTPGGYRIVKPGYSSVTAMLASTPFYIAHRGGSRDFPEMSLYAYGRSALHGYGALEVSLARTSDGVWFGLHDADINRTSGTTGLAAASTMTWAQIQSYQILGSVAVNNTTQANRPYMRFEELIALYYPSHVMFLDIKYAVAYQAEFIAKINALPGTPQDHIVGKAFGVSASFPNAMHAAGYKTWGYFYQTDVPTNLANYASYWDILGMDYTADSTAWTAVMSYGKPVVGHICPTVAAKNTAITYGAVGIMASGALAIIPTTPYSNN